MNNVSFGGKFNIREQILSATDFKTGEITNPISYSGLRKISFSGIKHDTFESLIKPKIKVLPGVSDNYVKNVQKEISTFPKEWLKKFNENGYEIILSKNFSQAYKSKRVYDPAIEIFEQQNPRGTLGVTYSEGASGKNFFVFCDKPPYSNKYMANIVTHELSHGVVNTTELDKNPQVIKLIEKDIQSAISERKFDKMSSEEKQMISHYFFNKNAYLPIDEIIADTYAWTKGKGCYGSGLVMDIYNPNLMINLFPNLADYLKTI